MVDASVLIKLFSDEAEFSLVKVLFTQLSLGKIELLAPDCILLEIGNVLAIGRSLSLNEVEKSLSIIQTSDLQTFQTTALLNDAIKFAKIHLTSVYDALYLALSRRENVPLLTYDKQLLKLSEFNCLKLQG